MKLDILAFGVHPDDVELSSGGTLLKHKEAGLKVGIVDLTRGERGTRGTAEDRDKEARNSAKILGLDARENLGLPDAFFEINKESKLLVVEAIRAYKPSIVLAPAISDRHPDHKRGGELVAQSIFLSGLIKIATERNGVNQEAWKPKQIYHYIQFRHAHPDFVVDISDQMERKMEAIKAFKSQFYDPDSKEAETLISSQGFMEYIKARSVEMGGIIGCKYGEGFQTEIALKVNNLMDVL
jgi:N-acetylglucosamine malate deacetylase 1